MTKLIYSALVAVGLILLYQFAFNSHEADVTTPNTPLKDQAKQISPGEKDLDIESARQQEVFSTNLGKEEREQPQILSWASEDSFYEIDLFLRSRGHHLKFEDNDYHSYSIGTLEELADAGDFTALHILAFEYQKEGQKGKALATYAKAATHGSTSALIDMSTFYQSVYYSLSDKGLSAPRKQAMIDALAHYKVAERRGDRLAKLSANSFIDAAEIDLSKEDRLEIDQRAEEIYKHLSKEREQLGLQEFDNHIPENVEAYYDSMMHSES